jgi:hypothetical protein
VLYAGAENAGECTGSSDEIDEAALELYAEPSGSSSLQFLILFFEAETG